MRHRPAPIEAELHSRQQSDPTANPASGGELNVHPLLSAVAPAAGSTTSAGPPSKPAQPRDREIREDTGSSPPQAPGRR
ncbi:hypothetical protein NDU88_005548 [Pleurodeles waltl]|uniref:Uncharacterized protein n=1 Tax=Pleurodeles waltl TaxID=8319 RepID=A0AAV7SM05_PLEWA|nr:hypothetical protein NDU88_005548 [Pleurodeles waltl]